MTEPLITSCTLDELIANARGDILLITPLYPSEENPYACAFVHTRVRAYLKAGLSVDVAVRAFDGKTGFYSYEGVNVWRLSMNDLQILLRTKTYRCIAIHFIENEYARVLESCDLSSSHLFIWCHGAETLYWDRPKFTTPYFSKPRIMEPPEVADLQARDAMLRRFNERANTTFVFVSEFAKQRSTELTGIVWKDATVIPNPIDFDSYAYRDKSPDLRTKVFCAKTHDDYSCYAMDTVVRTIIALSRRPCFDSLSFTIAGAGSVHEKLVAPLRAFPNVHVIDRFLSRKELVEAHGTHGIALFPTRFDTQGVAMCEAAASGLAVISSKRKSVADFLGGGDDADLLAPVDDFHAYADIVEKLYENPALFEKCSRASYESVARSCSPSITIDREIELFSSALHERHAVQTPAKEDGPCLSVGVIGATEQDLAAFDRASELWAQGRLEAFSVTHAAEALDKARGAYVKVVGKNDFVDPENLSSFINILENRPSEVVLSDVWELAPKVETPQRTGNFDFMVEGQAYDREDLMLDTYGFGDAFPDARFGVFQTEWLAAVRAAFGDDAVFDAEYGTLIGLAPRMSYAPIAAWHIRLEEQAAVQPHDESAQQDAHLKDAHPIRRKLQNLQFARLRPRGRSS